jgi:trigger factor
MELRMPIFEDKVVDFALELADVTDKPVSQEELFSRDDGDDHDGEHDHVHGPDCDHDHDHDHKHGS